MTITEMGELLVRVQLGDNREVDIPTIAYWHDLIGDMSIQDAFVALRRFRRERPGTYLEPGHLLELAGVADAVPSAISDVTAEVIEESRLRALAAAGVTEEEFAANKHDRGWVLAHFPPAPAVEPGDPEAWPE